MQRYTCTSLCYYHCVECRLLGSVKLDCFALAVGLYTCTRVHAVVRSLCVSWAFVFCFCSLLVRDSTVDMAAYEHVDAFKGKPNIDFFATWRKCRHCD